VGAERPQRYCDGCSEVDDHPRHIIGVANHPSQDRSPEQWHLDCHAAHGCDSCAARLAGASGRTGAELMAHFAEQRVGDHG